MKCEAEVAADVPADASRKVPASGWNPRRAFRLRGSHHSGVYVWALLSAAVMVLPASNTWAQSGVPGAAPVRAPALSESAPAPAPFPTDATGNVAPGIPPTLVERLLQQILVERDLATAQSMLVESLVPALNQYQNPEWTARVYALLSAVATLGDDTTQAKRLALRAVTLDEKVALEPELGERPLAILKDAKETMKARSRSAKLVADVLPVGLELYVDGKSVPLPETVELRAGDHLLQIVVREGVVARQWVTFEDGQTLREPPPFSTVRASIKAVEKAPPIPMDELEQLLAQASKAESELQGIDDTLEIEEIAAREGRHTERAVCLAEVRKRLQYIQGEVTNYKERLQFALNEEDPADLRHLLTMIQLARDEALRLSVEQEACLEQPLRDVPLEIRVVQTPPPPPTPVSLEEARGVHTFFALAPLPELTPATTLLRPPPPTFEPLTPPPATDPQARQRAVRAELRLDMLYDSNPLRATPALLESENVEQLYGDDLSPYFGLRATPSIAWSKDALSLEARLPLLLTPQRMRLLDGEIQATGRWQSAQVGLELRHDTFPVESLGPEFGEFLRLAAGMKGAKTLTPSSSVAVTLGAQARVEHLQGRQGLDGVVGTEDLNPVLRFGGSLEADAAWKPFPFSAVLGDLTLGLMHGHSLDAHASSSFLDGHRTTFFPRARLGVRGHLAEGVWGEARAAYTVAGVLIDAFTPLVSPEYGLGGSVGLIWEHKPHRLELKLERTLSPVFFADIAVWEGLSLEASLGSPSHLHVTLQARAGRQHLTVVEGPAPGGGPSYPSAIIMSPGTWTQRSVAGGIGVSYRPLPQFPVWLDGHFQPSAFLGQSPRGVATVRETQWTLDTQVLLGLRGQY